MVIMGKISYIKHANQRREGWSVCLRKRQCAPNPRMHATWLIGALFEFLTRISVHFPATALTPYPPSA